MQSVADFFNAPKRSSPKKSVDTQDLLEKSIDPSVLEELPEEIRREYEGLIQSARVIPASPVTATKQPAFKTPLPRKHRHESEHQPEKMFESSDLLPSPSQIDASVLDELPADLVQELIDHRTRRKEAQRTSEESSKPREIVRELTAFPSPSQIDDQVFNELPSDIRDEITRNRDEKTPSKLVTITASQEPRFSSQDLNPSPSQVDASVLNCLPIHLQKEIKVHMKEKKLEKDKVERTKKRMNEEALPKIRENVRTYLKPPTTKPCFFGISKEEDVADMVANEISSAQEPSFDVVQGLRWYIRDLLDASYIHAAEIIITRIYTTLISSRISPSIHQTWLHLLKTLTQTTQSFAIEQFGAKLKSLTIFELDE